jgi:hypothetical protein
MQADTRLRTLIPILLVVLCAPLPAAAEQEAPDVKSLMTGEDFEASGLDKLSEAERDHLSGWLARYRAGAVEGPRPKATREEREKEQKIEITAQVIPAFRGWDGKTMFRLDNGQVWQQRQAGKLRYSGSDFTVVISPNMLGGYVLRHEDSGRAIGVKRIR